MLLRKECGRYQDRDLFAALDGEESGAHRDFRLTEADVAADQPVGRVGRTEIRNDLVNGALLIQCDFKRKLIGESLIVLVRVVELKLLRGLWPAIFR